MCDSVFLVDPSGSYYFEAPSRWVYKNLPPNLTKLFNEDKAVEKAHSLVLGSNNSFFITYKGRGNNKDWWYHRGVPKSLIQFVCNKQKAALIKLGSLILALGPDNNSWFACDGTRAHFENIPEYLEKAMDKHGWPPGSRSWLSTPRIVQLGVNNNYILITSNGAGSWVLKSYPVLLEIIGRFSKAKGNGFACIHNIHLNPHQAGALIRQGTNGETFSWGLTEGMSPDFANISQALKSDTATSREIAMARAQQELIRCNNSP